MDSTSFGSIVGPQINAMSPPPGGMMPSQQPMGGALAGSIAPAMGATPMTPTHYRRGGPVLRKATGGITAVNPFSSTSATPANYWNLGGPEQTYFTGWSQPTSSTPAASSAAMPAQTGWQGQGNWGNGPQQPSNGWGRRGSGAGPGPEMDRGGGYASSMNMGNITGAGPATGVAADLMGGVSGMGDITGGDAGTEGGGALEAGAGGDGPGGEHSDAGAGREGAYRRGGEVHRPKKKGPPRPEGALSRHHAPAGKAGHGVTIIIPIMQPPPMNPLHGALSLALMHHFGQRQPAQQPQGALSQVAR